MKCQNTNNIKIRRWKIDRNGFFDKYFDKKNKFDLEVIKDFDVENSYRKDERREDRSEKEKFDIDNNIICLSMKIKSIL